MRIGYTPARASQALATSPRHAAPQCYSDGPATGINGAGQTFAGREFSLPKVLCGIVSCRVFFTRPRRLGWSPEFTLLCCFIYPDISGYHESKRSQWSIPENGTTTACLNARHEREYGTEADCPNALSAILPAPKAVRGIMN